MIELKDILINARQESHRMRHHYLGVEHLFIALLEIRGGLLPTILADEGLTSDYIIGALRLKAGKGSRHLLWAGVPSTPRVEIVLGIAQEIAREQGRTNITERDLLTALLEEGDSLPVRVLRAMGADIERLRQRARSREFNAQVPQTFVTVEFAPTFMGELSKDQLFVLRAMFRSYARIRVEAQLVGGYTQAIVLAVTPIHADNREDAALVVKIGHTDDILDEAQRYESYVRNTLPPLTARLEDKPTAPDTCDLAGLKYTLLTDDEGKPTNLHTALLAGSFSGLSAWIRDSLYENFGARWWQQRRPYRFEVWQEYDWLLPPILTLEVINTHDIPPDAQVFRFPIKRGRFRALNYGETVVIENFVVHRVNQDNATITLALGHGSSRALQVEVRGINFDHDTYYRGEIVERITGRVWMTRQEQLLLALRALEPDFDARQPVLTIMGRKLPNPLEQYSRLLDMTLMGSISTIHGDLHAGNIMLGQNRSALLIDFAHARDGHTLFDWATLEISLLNDLLGSYLTAGWDSVYSLLPVLQQFTGAKASGAETPHSLNAIYSVREIVREHLAHPGKWEEYWVALALIALRAMTWATLPVPNRRLMLLVAAVAGGELDRLELHEDASNDATEFTRNSRQSTN
jgi:hypothetical protein